MANPKLAQQGKATRFSKENPAPGPGRKSVVVKIFEEFISQQIEVVIRDTKENGGKILKKEFKNRFVHWLETAERRALGGGSDKMLMFLIDFSNANKKAILLFQQQINAQLNFKGDRLETLVSSGQLKLTQEIPENITPYHNLDED